MGIFFCRTFDCWTAIGMVNVGLPLPDGLLKLTLLVAKERFIAGLRDESHSSRHILTLIVASGVFTEPKV